MQADKVIESFLDRLARILVPVASSTRLLAADVIDERTWEEACARDVADYERNLGILKAVRKRVRADIAYFHKFCDVLEEEEYTKAISKNIQDELQKREETFKTTSSPSLDSSIASNPPRAPKRRQQCIHVGRGDLTKRRRLIKEGKIRGETVLMDIAKDVSEKWEEVGVYLGLSTKSIKNELSSENGLTLNKKAFHMLLLWRDGTAEDDFTYTALAKALEASGLNSCAMKYCYTADLDRAED